MGNRITTHTHLHPKEPVWTPTGGARRAGFGPGASLSLRLPTPLGRGGRAGPRGGVPATILAMCPIHNLSRHASLKSSMHDYVPMLHYTIPGSQASFFDKRAF